VFIRKQQAINEYWPMKLLGRSHMTKDTLQPGLESHVSFFLKKRRNRVKR